MTPLSTAPSLPPSQFTVCTSRFARLRKETSAKELQRDRELEGGKKTRKRSDMERDRKREGVGGEKREGAGGEGERWDREDG